MASAAQSGAWQDGSSSVGSALQFFRSVLQLPLQPAQADDPIRGQFGTASRNPPQHANRFSSRNFTQETYQQQQQQQHHDASIPVQQQRQQQHQGRAQPVQQAPQDWQAPALQQAQVPGSRGDTTLSWLGPQAQQQQPCVQAGARHNTHGHPQHQQDQAGNAGGRVTQQAAWPTASHWTPNQLSRSPWETCSDGGAAAQAEAQLQPTPAPQAHHHQQQQRQQQLQHTQQRLNVSLQPQQQGPLQDVSNLLLMEQQQHLRRGQQEQHTYQQQQQQLQQLQRNDTAKPLQRQQPPSWPQNQQHQNQQHQQQRQWQQQLLHGTEQADGDAAPHQVLQRERTQAAAGQDCAAPNDRRPQQHYTCVSQQQHWHQHHQQQGGKVHSQPSAVQQPQIQHQLQQKPLQQQQQQQRSQRACQHSAVSRPTSQLLLQRLCSSGIEPEESGDAGLQQQQQQGGATVPPTVKTTAARWPWLGGDRRDAKGRAPGTPGYDPSTLYIPPAALAAMSEFGRQFWGIKCRAMDLVLFVRHGSFYNLFDVDADVGLRVGLNLSGPPAANMWKVGCSKDHFATWAAKVLAQGYSVGRVEEIQQPGSRSGAAGPKVGGGSSSSKLLVRQLVRIYTPGTAVEGLLLDDQDHMPHPLICLAELPFSTSSPAAAATPTAAKSAATAHAVGICVLDISSGVCRVGAVSTADDPGRSALAVALLMCDPSEAVAVRNSLTAATVTLLRQHFEMKAAAASGFSGSDVSPGERVAGVVQGISWLPTSAAAAVLSHPADAVLQDCLNEQQAQQVRQIAAVTAAATGAAGRGSRSFGSNGSPWAPPAAASGIAAAAVLSAVAVGLKQLERCSLLADVLPTLDIQPLGPLTPHGPAQPGRPLLLDNNAIVTLDLLPWSTANSSSGSAAPVSASVGAPAASKGSPGGAASSLFGMLDRAASAAGRRRLKQWLCRPLTLASAINERLDVLDLFITLPAAAAHLQERLSGLPDADRLLPKAAAAMRALLQQQQRVMDAQQQQQQHQQQQGSGEVPVTDVTHMLEGSAAHRERAWQALVTLPPCLMGLIEAVATLRREVAPHTNTAKLPLMRKAELAAARAVPATTAVHKLLADATWVDAAPAREAAVAGAGRSKGRKAAAAPAGSCTGGGISGGGCIRLAAGSDSAYDAAVAAEQELQERYAAEVDAHLQWYRNSRHLGWAQQQQQLENVQLQDVTVADEGAGVLGLVVQVPDGHTLKTAGSASSSTAAPSTETAAAGVQGQPGNGSSTAAVTQWATRLLAPGHSLVGWELLTQADPPGQHSATKPPAGRGQKAQAGGRGGARGRKSTGRGAAGSRLSGALSAAGPSFEQELLVLRVHVPELQDLWQELQGAEQQVSAAAAAALSKAADAFLSAYGLFRNLVAAVSDLDVLAGFAQVIAPGNAPPGCSFCRPQFAAASAAVPAAAATPKQATSRTPLLHLEGLWHPLLGVHNSSSSSVVCNDVVLGRDRPGAMLLTGANMGGKSTLLRSTCVAVIMAQVGCYVAANKAVLEPVDVIFTRIGAADAIMCGKSTFMVEMSETAACLAAASRSSLIVLDELGRGTSTHDGYALAYAVLQHLARPSQRTNQSQPDQSSEGVQQLLPRVLFATHYHMLTQEPGLQGCVQSCHMATTWDEVQQQLVHCYKLQPGPAPTGSCGIEVAALAGLPDAVVQRAAAVAAVMQQHCEAKSGGGAKALLPKIRGLT